MKHLCPKCLSTEIAIERRLGGDSHCNSCGYDDKSTLFITSFKSVDFEKEDVKAVFKDYTIKLRQDVSCFVDVIFPGLSQEQKDICIYSIFANCSLSQKEVCLRVYGLELEEKDLKGE